MRLFLGEQFCHQRCGFIHGRQVLILYLLRCSAQPKRIAGWPCAFLRIFAEDPHLAKVDMNPDVEGIPMVIQLSSFFAELQASALSGILNIAPGLHIYRSRSSMKPSLAVQLSGSRKCTTNISHSVKFSHGQLLRQFEIWLSGRSTFCHAGTTSCSVSNRTHLRMQARDHDPGLGPGGFSAAHNIFRRSTHREQP